MCDQKHFKVINIYHYFLADFFCDGSSNKTTSITCSGLVENSSIGVESVSTQSNCTNVIALSMFLRIRFFCKSKN